MAYIKVKFCFFAFLLLIIFFITSLIVSISFMEIPKDDDSLDVTDILESIPGTGEKYQLKNLQRKAKRVQDLKLKNLERTKHCRFQCKPAIDYYDSGIRTSMREAEPKVRIMITHCIHCLISKGLMNKIRERSRRKRDIIDQMKITPYIKPTESIKISKSTSETVSKDNDKHYIFGGWISNIDRSNLIKYSDLEERHTFKSRKLLNVVKHIVRRAEKKKKVLKAPKKTIVVGKDDEEYDNNYEDNFDSDVPDLEKQAQKTQDAMTYFLIGSFAFFALLFIFVFPVASFIRMCLKNYDSNVLIVSDVLHCRDPKYRLVKEMCDKCEIPIPDYKLYKKLMRIYEAKHAETVSKEKKSKDDSDSG